jgi:hypothetical protein
VEAQVKALLATVNEDIPVNFQPSDVSNEIISLKLGEVMVLTAFQINIYGILQEDFLCI